jgi:hypothetical protein
VRRAFSSTLSIAQPPVVHDWLMPDGSVTKTDD